MCPPLCFQTRVQATLVGREALALSAMVDTRATVNAATPDTTASVSENYYV